MTPVIIPMPMSGIGSINIDNLSLEDTRLLAALLLISIIAFVITFIKVKEDYVGKFLLGMIGGCGTLLMLIIVGFIYNIFTKALGL